MMDGQQVDPGMPQGATVSAENAQQAPAEGIPSTLMSPLNASTQGGGGMNVLYLARRAATTLQKMDEGTRMAEMNRMQMTSPQLYSLVLQIIESEKGSQENPLNPVQSPQPTLKPTRRPSSTGV